MIRALPCMLAIACGESSIVIEPVIERPIDDEADVLPELTQIRIALENAGEDELDDVFERGETIALPGVPLIDGLVVRLDGFIEGQGVAVGRSCTFSLADGNRASPRIYLSAVVRTGELVVEAAARRGGTSLVLPDDTVLLLGGEDNTSLELFDPRTGVLAAIDHPAFEGRTGAAVATFEGRPAIIGGTIPGGAPAPDVVLLSSTGTLERVQDLTATLGRSHLSATTLADGEILITGGSDAAGVSNRIVRMGRDPETDVIELEIVNSATLGFARERHAVIPLGDAGASLLITGGNDGAAPIKESEIYRPNNDERITLESPKFDLLPARTRHRTTLLPDESVVIFGGLDAAGAPIRAVQRFSLIDGIATANGLSFPPTAPAIGIATLTLPTGQILLVGGRQQDGMPAQTDVFTIDFNADSNTVSLNPRDPLAIPRVDPTLTLLCDGTVLISGGTDGDAPVERYNPNVRPKL